MYYYNYITKCTIKIHCLKYLRTKWYHNFKYTLGLNRMFHRNCIICYTIQHRQGVRDVLLSMWWENSIGEKPCISGRDLDLWTSRLWSHAVTQSSCSGALRVNCWLRDYCALPTSTPLGSRSRQPAVRSRAVTTLLSHRMGPLTTCPQIQQGLKT